MIIGDNVNGYKIRMISGKQMAIDPLEIILVQQDSESWSEFRQRCFDYANNLPSYDWTGEGENQTEDDYVNID
jgi:hypothetical protein